MVCMAQGQEERLANYAARGEDNSFHGEESYLYVLPGLPTPGLFDVILKYCNSQGDCLHQSEWIC